MLVVQIILKKKAHSNCKIGSSPLEIYCGGWLYLKNYKKQLSEYKDGDLQIWVHVSVGNTVCVDNPQSIVKKLVGLLSKPMLILGQKRGGHNS